MSHRFSYVKYNDRSTEVQAKFKELFEAIETFADQSLSSGRYKSLLMTALEEAYMWTGKSIRDEQMLPMAEAEKLACEQPSRNKE